MSAFAGAVRTMFRDGNMSAPAIWYPRGGAPAVALRIMTKSPDQLVGFGQGQFATATLVADVMVADAPGIGIGDRLVIGGQGFVVQAEPMRDRERLVYSLDLRPASPAP